MNKANYRKDMQLSKVLYCFDLVIKQEWQHIRKQNLLSNLFEQLDEIRFPKSISRKILFN